MVMVGAVGGAAIPPMNWPKELGLVPTATVAMTVLVAVLITETLLLPRFGIYTLAPLGVTATPIGKVPTVTVAITVFVAVLIAETVLPFWFAT